LKYYYEEFPWLEPLDEEEDDFDKEEEGQDTEENEEEEDNEEMEEDDSKLVSPSLSSVSREVLPPEVEAAQSLTTTKAQYGVEESEDLRAWAPYQSHLVQLVDESAAVRYSILYILYMSVNKMTMHENILTECCMGNVHCIQRSGQRIQKGTFGGR